MEIINHIRIIIRNILQEIVQSEITPTERGAREDQKGDDTSGIYSKLKSPGDYFKKSKQSPYLWHIKSKDSGSEEQTASNDSNETNSESKSDGGD